MDPHPQSPITSTQPEGEKSDSSETECSSNICVDDTSNMRPVSRYCSSTVSNHPSSPSQSPARSRLRRSHRLLPKKPVPKHKKIVNNNVSHYNKDPSGLTKLIHTFQKLEASSKHYLEWSSDSNWAICINDNTPNPPDMRPVTVSLYCSPPCPEGPEPIFTQPIPSSKSTASSWTQKYCQHD